MNRYQEEIYKTIDILTDKKIKEAKFDITKQGRVISVDGDTCKVRIHDQEYTCKIRRSIFIKPGDIVYVVFPQNSNVDRYVDVVLGDNEELLPPTQQLKLAVEKIQTDIQNIDKNIHELQESVEEKGVKIDQIQNDLSETKEKITLAQQSIATVQGQVQNINTNIFNIQEGLQNVNDTVEQVSQQVQTNQESIQNITESIQDMQEKIDYLISVIGSISGN